QPALTSQPAAEPRAPVGEDTASGAAEPDRPENVSADTPREPQRARADMRDDPPAPVTPIVPLPIRAPDDRVDIHRIETTHTIREVVERRERAPAPAAAPSPAVVQALPITPEQPLQPDAPREPASVVVAAPTVAVAAPVAAAPTPAQSPAPPDPPPPLL